MVPNEVEDQIVTLISLGKIFFRVINHVVGADRSDKIDIARAAHAGHFGAERFRDLHGERAYASGRAVDQDLLPGLNFSFVAKTLQRGDRRHRDRSRLLECHVRRFQNDCSIRQNTHVLGDCAVFSAEYFVARFEVRYVFANCFNGSGIVDTQSSVFWFAQVRRAGEKPQAADSEVEWIYGSRANSDQDLVVIRNRLFDFFNLENLGTPIFAMGNGFHRISGVGLRSQSLVDIQ